MAKTENRFVQIIKTMEGEEVNLGPLRRPTFIESMSLDAPLLILSFADTDSEIRDTFSLVEEEEIKVKLADIGATDGIDTYTKYKILTAKEEQSGALWVITCLDSRVSELIEPVTTAQAFVDTSVNALLRRLIPGADDYQVDAIPSVGSYWLSVGQQPISIIKRLERDFGGYVWLARGVVYFRLVRNMPTMSPDLGLLLDAEYEAGNAAAERPMKDIEVLGDTALMTKTLAKQAVGWSETQGVIKSSLHAEQASTYTACTSQAMLRGRSAGLVPVVRWRSAGDGEIEVSGRLPLIWNRRVTEQPVDEKMPTEIIVMAVTHQTEQEDYTIKITGAVAHE